MSTPDGDAWVDSRPGPVPQDPKDHNLAEPHSQHPAGSAQPNHGVGMHAGPHAAPLHQLATAYGVATDYVDWQGEACVVADATLIAVLADLDVDATTPISITAALDQSRSRADGLPPVVVARDDRQTKINAPTGMFATVITEAGDRRPLDVVRDGRLIIPDGLPLGYHRLELAGPDRRIGRELIIVPARIPLPAALDGQRQWGTATQLYAMSSQRSWGIGDLDDLARLAEWSAGDHDAGFVLVNPLHASGVMSPLEPSPYLPASRRFFDPIYLAIDRLAEYQDLDAAERAEVTGLARQATHPPSELIDRDRVWAAKLAALRILHRYAGRSAGRLAAYRQTRGPALTDFATWCVLVQHFGPHLRRWPAELRDPNSSETRAFADERPTEIDFWCWVQYACDTQLGQTQQRATQAGMALGVLHDLAVGVGPDGADGWTLGDLFAKHCEVGAPPDAFNQLGQGWGQHPWRPDRLAQAGYAPFREMVANLLRHAGGLRIDHVMGLFRLWWVPDGQDPAAGTYVHYDSDALVGILALEATRAGAVIIGEDLGTVEPQVRTELAARGVLGTSILWFEQDWDAGVPLPPQAWRPMSLASVTTHDLPPTAGYLAGAHIDLRDRLGLLTETREAEESRLRTDLQAWRDQLTRSGFELPDVIDSAAHEAELINALHAFLGLTPALLLCVSVSDLAGDRRAVNQPGTRDEYPNWRLPLAGGQGQPVFLEQLITSPRANILAEVMRAAVTD